MHKFHTATAADYDSARNAVTRITLEANISANVINMFRNVFPSINDYLGEVVANFRAKDNTSFKLEANTKAFSSFNAKASSINFIAYRNVLLPCPEGFNSKYLPYLENLQAIAHRTLGEGSKLLEDYHNVLSTFISNKDAKTQLRDHTVFYKKVDAELRESKQHLSSFFTTKHNSSHLPASALLDRMQDMSVSIDSVKELNKLRLAFSSKDTLGQVERISQLLGIIVDQSKDEAITNISGAAALNISEGATVVASYVEFMAVVRYRLEEAISSVGGAATKISQVSV